MKKEFELIKEDFLSNLRQLRSKILKKLKSKDFGTNETENSIQKQIERINEAIYRNSLSLDEKLEESEEKYRYLFENSPYVVLLINSRGEIVETNNKVFELTGYTYQDLQGVEFKKILNIFSEETLQFLLKKFNDEMTNNILIPVEVPYHRKDGTPGWLNLHASRIEINKESFIQIIAQDITERKNSEEKLRDSEEGLKASEEKYRRLYETFPDAIIVTDKDGIILDCNSQTEEIFGFKKEEFILQDYMRLNVNTSEQISLFRERFKTLQEDKALKPIEMQVKKKDGSLMWTSYQSSMFKLGDDVLIETIIKDITEKKQAEELIQQEIEVLKGLDKVRRDLITRASHELKTPLTSISGSTELLLNFYTDHYDDEVKSLIEIIDKGEKRLRSFIEDLLDVSRIESNKLEIKKEKVNIVEIMKDCINDISFILNKRQLTLTHDLKKFVNRDIYIFIDKIRIEQVLLNVLSNAIKNTPPKGAISVELEVLDMLVEIKITDTGVGFTSEEKEKIFQRFGKIERFEDDLDVEIGGSGLGLFISKELVELHQGIIWLESEGRNKGTTVYINLPM